MELAILGIRAQRASITAKIAYSIARLALIKAITFP